MVLPVGCARLPPRKRDAGQQRSTREAIQVANAVVDPERLREAEVGAVRAGLVPSLDARRERADGDGEVCAVVAAEA